MRETMHLDTAAGPAQKFVNPCEGERVIRICRGTSTFGLVLSEGRCVRAAPVMKWAKGKDWNEIRRWLQKVNASWLVWS